MQGRALLKQTFYETTTRMQMMLSGNFLTAFHRQSRYFPGGLPEHLLYKSLVTLIKLDNKYLLPTLRAGTVSY